MEVGAGSHEAGMQFVCEGIAFCQQNLGVLTAEEGIGSSTLCYGKDLGGNWWNGLCKCTVTTYIYKIIL